MTAVTSASRTLPHSCLPSALGAKPTPDSGLPIEPNGLYMLLWSTGYNGIYHWAILLAQTSKSGIIFHQTTIFAAVANATRSGIPKAERQPHNSGASEWRFVMDLENVAESPGLLCALKVGVLEHGSSEAWITAIKDCVCAADVEYGHEFTCRTWALAALYELANGGFIGMVADRRKIADVIEKESRLLARDSEILGTRMVTQSELF